MKVVSTLALRYNESVPSKASFRGGHQMRGQVRREVVAVELDVHEVHGEAELVGVQHAVLVHVRQLPDLAQHVVGQLGLDHLL